LLQEQKAEFDVLLTHWLNETGLLTMVLSSSHMKCFQGSRQLFEYMIVGKSTAPQTLKTILDHLKVSYSFVIELYLD